MPPIEEAAREDYAVLWNFTGAFDDNGEPVVAPPMELDPTEGTGVRWIYERKEMIGPKGDPVSVEATAVVDRKIEQGSRMWQGRLEDYDEATVKDVLWVAAYYETKDVKGRETFREVGLTRFRETES